MTPEKYAKQYKDAGFSLCAIKPESKRPHGNEWEQNPKDPSFWAGNESYGMGVIHQHSGTCSIDIDHMEHARTALSALGVDLDSLLQDGVQILSREGRGKLLYQAPQDLPQKRHNLNWPTQDDKTKRFCVIEFRAGLVQDVLPPSIHPDTGEPYQWKGDWQSLPELPAVLLSAWKNWDIAKEAMQEACPWDDQPKRHIRPKENKRSGDSASVIDAFNAAHDPRTIIEEHGYKKIAYRWLSPHSESMIPGVVVLPDTHPEKLFVHHASDPLANGHAHDAFSLYCELDHGGDMHAAVSEAASLLGMEREEDRVGAEAAKRLMGNRNNVTVIPPPQRESQVVTTAPQPGPIPVPLLRDVEGWVRNQMHSVKPDAITQSVLSFACALTARRYTSHEGQPATTFFGVTDSSTAGLRPIKGVLYGLASRVGERRALRGTTFPSSGVLYQSLLRCPRMYWITDEYGHMVQMSRRQQSGAMESAIAVLHECYTGQTLYIDPETARGGQKERAIEDCDIYAPSVTMLALMAHDQLSALGHRSEYGRGTLQQMLTIPAGETDPAHEPDLTADPPERLVEWCKRLASVPGIAGSEQSPTMPPQTTMVHWDAEVADIMRAARADVRLLFEAEERQPWKGMAHGYMQSVIRMAAALSAWDNPDSPVVSPDIARWCVTWAKRCLCLTLPRLEVTASDGDQPDIQQRVMEVLYEANKAMTPREISRRCRAFRSLGTEDRHALLGTLSDDGYLIAEPTGKTTRYKIAKKAA